MCVLSESRKIIKNSPECQQSQQSQNYNEAINAMLVVNRRFLAQLEKIDQLNFTGV